MSSELAKLIRERFGDPATAERERPGAVDTPDVQAARRRMLNAAMKPKTGGK
jgi:hypothetical protein